MAKINSKALDPQRYACIQAEQRELEQQYSTHITMARLCPYCKLRLETLCKGAHGATYLKCPQCGGGGFLPACCIPHRITANNRSVPNN